MKKDIRFAVAVFALVLCSVLILVGSMLAIGADYGDEKELDGTDASIGVIGENDAPLSQEEMREKFRGMMSFDESKGTVTVITEEFLKEYWADNYEKEVVKSLSYEEVVYIIQDSINLVNVYDNFILTGFSCDSKDEEVASRFPKLEEKGLEREISDGASIYRKDLTEIINYRLAALSSPKVFISAKEAIEYIGFDPDKYFGTYSDQVFYIPGFTSGTDRDYLLEFFGDAEIWEERKEGIDYFTLLETETGFSFLERYATVCFTSDGKTEEIYPRGYSISFAASSLSGSNGIKTCVINLYLPGKSFTMSSPDNNFEELRGTFKRDGNDLVLTLSNINKTVTFAYKDGLFVSKSELSRVNLEKGMRFRTNNHSFWDYLLD